MAKETMTGFDLLMNGYKASASLPKEIHLTTSKNKQVNSKLIKDVNTTSNMLMDAMNISNTATGTKKITDGSFINTVSKTGLADAASSAGQFMLDMITFNRYECTAIYHGSWVLRRVIDKVAQDMWSSGININSDRKPEDIAKVYKRLSKIKSELIYATQQARLYGGAAALIMVDDGVNDLSKPLNIKGIKKGARIRFFTADRWYGVSTSNELVSNYRNMDFGKPKYYNFDLDGTFDIDDDEESSGLDRVHHSRVLRFVNRRSPKLIEQMLNGWGVSELEHMYQDLMNYENTKNSTASLVGKALLEIVKISGMRGMISGLSRGNAASQASLAGQLTALNQFRTSNNLVLMDKEDDYTQDSLSFSGLDSILSEQRSIIAGAAEMPQVLLFGDTKGGLTSDSPAEIEFYAQNILGKQEQDLRPVLDKLLPILYQVEGLEAERDIDYEFESIAGLSVDKKQSVLSSAKDTAVGLAEAGLITHETALKEIQEVSKATGFGTNISERDFELARRNDKAEAENPIDSENVGSPEDIDYVNEKLSDGDYDEAKEKALKKVAKMKDKKKSWFRR